MPLKLSVRWLSGNGELDRRVVPLLRAVAHEGSLNRAVSALRMSYRHAWGLLGKTERALGQTLVMMERGRGARLSAFAEELLELDATANTVLERELAGPLQALNGRAAGRGASGAPPLSMHASHDFALVALKDMLEASGADEIALQVRGSLDCLMNLARRECDVAGFHMPEATAGAAALAPYRRWIRMRDLCLVRFVSRQQGLIVARGNPKQLQSLPDLVSSGARFVNRQSGSGTRLCFDRLIAAANVLPSQITGYETEEFTHAAVAAMIASGMADAGFGIEAAAHRSGLDFVPIATERYYLAARARALKSPAFQAIVEAMKGAAFQEVLKTFPGYEADGIGEIVPAGEVLKTRPPSR